MEPTQPNDPLAPQVPPPPNQPVVMPPSAPAPGFPPGPAVASPPPQPAPPASRKLLLVIAVLVIVIVVGAVAAVMLLGHKNSNNKSGSGGTTSSNGSNSSSSEPEVALQTYTNDQFHISFKYPAAWGKVTMSQTTGPQNGATGVSSYNATFSSKTGGTDVLGDVQPYLFRINSYKWSVGELDFTNTPSLAYRTVGVGADSTNSEVSPGLNYCVRNDSDSETCTLFSDLGGWTTVNHAILAKQLGDSGVGLFVPLAPNTGENYTMASFYSASMDDYDDFKQIAQSFSGQMR